jgi:hypothetical protein
MERFTPHLDFLKDMDTCFLGNGSDKKIPVQAKQQYLFFIANVIVKDRDLSGSPPSFFYRATKDLLRYHKEYLDFNKDLQNIIIKKADENGPKKVEEIEHPKNVEDIVRRMTLLHQGIDI